MSKWTPEPWGRGKPFTRLAPGEWKVFYAEQACPVAVWPLCDAEFDRATACVNALAGLNPEAVGDVVALAQRIADEAEEIGFADATTKIADAIDWEWIVDLRLALAKLREAKP